ncbi:DUF1934 domain-containing protein [Oxobacter pfennigii]|uniref:DUF1934 domain-containing protein n=1 Tax=Oxobacter pfennigii TaxID=36849 RepID=UPI0006D403AC|nr:DUF1934 domain-containing protein [Oxobacter pfennigii]
MNKNVLVTVKSTQKVNNEEEVIELVTPGKFYKKNSTYFIVYEETEVTGMEGTTTTVKIEKEDVNLIRFGSTITNLKFRTGVKDISLYKTPYGTFELIIIPSKVEINVDDSGGIVNLLYQLDAAGLHTTTNELSIKIQ